MWTRWPCLTPSTKPGSWVTRYACVCRALGPDIPGAWICGRPWTLACYLMQGASRDGFPTAKAMLREQPGLMRDLLAKIARATAAYLKAQISAGAAAVQLFDTWAGELSVEDYRDFELPAMQLLLSELAAGETPVIMFTKSSNHLLDLLPDTGATVLSVDAQWICGKLARVTATELPCRETSIRKSCSRHPKRSGVRCVTLLRRPTAAATF